MTAATDAAGPGTLRAGSGTPARAGNRRTRPVHVATMLGTALSAQVGAATGAHAFATIGPAGVVAVRQLVAAAVLVPLARPPVRTMTWRQWWPALLLAGVFAVMNLSLYTAIDRLGLGLAVTLEFLGPLSVAVVRSRRLLHAGIAVVAGAGVYVLILPGPSSDWPGIGLALFAAGLWVAYILLNRLLGTRLPGLQAPAVAASLAAAAYLPVVAVLVATGRMSWAALGFAVVAGLLSSAVPYAGDLVVLRHVPPRVFGVFMSMHPVLAALVGTVMLGQLLDGHEWAGLVVIVLANATAVTTAQDG
ncbi:DMT family transporter [Kineosporia sp. R_H_3]|uniref:EamA family transporter n=1 Tax=Kineosporia sp. R_H_3 TaxID=1961848 RepID=UPI000B4AF4B0|nr:EamA family transporter [Kineosporia sp. R_H_3]